MKQKKWGDPASGIEILWGFLTFFSAIAALCASLIHSIIHCFNQGPPETIPVIPLPDDPTTIHQQVIDAIKATNFPSKQEFALAFFERMMAQPRLKKLNPSIQDIMINLAALFYKVEHFTDPPTPLTDVVTGIEAARYADRLELMKRRFADPAKTLDLFTRTLLTSFLAFADHLPAIARTEEEHPLCTVPLVDVIQNVGQAVYDTTLPYYSTAAADLDLFHDLKPELIERHPDKNDKWIEPYDFKGTPQQILNAYLPNSPYELLFECKVPFGFDDKTRMEHFHLIAGSGWGKTQFIQSLILRDLQKDNPPALIIIDSQEDMLHNIQQLAIFNDKLADRLVIVDPSFVPALNVFTDTADRMKKYTLAIREQVEADVIQLYNYIFGAIASELTSKQNVAFSFVVRLMRATPDATLHTLLDLMEEANPKKFAPIISKLDPTAQAFFKNQFFNKSFAPTRQQIARRLYSVLSVPSFDRMFGTPENKLDMFDCIQSEKIVLVNTSKALLKNDACALFGRYMIAQTMSAVFERVAVPEKDRKPAFLIIDEAADYFDENLESLLTQARKFHLGVLFAHQAMSQMSQSLQGIVAGNTSIKVAGGISDKDARAIAPDMRATSDFLTNLNKTDRSAQFGAYIRNKTASAVRIDVPFGLLEKELCMTEPEHAALIERNRARYSATPPDDTPISETLPSEPDIRPPPPHVDKKDTPDKRKPAPPKADDEDPIPAKDY